MATKKKLELKTAYKLSYDVAGYEGVSEKIALTELELADAIIDMERDVGMFVNNVKIEMIKRPKDVRYKPQEEVLKRIEAHTKILIKHNYR